MNARISALFASALLVATTGCGRDRLFEAGARGGDAPQIAIRPAGLELRRDQAFRIDVVQLTETGTVSLIGRPGLTLKSADVAIAQLEADGSGIALAGGTTTLQAAFAGRVAIAPVTVLSARLERIEVTPNPLNLALGQSAPLTVTGLLDDGNTLDLSSGASGTTYASSDTAVVTVDADGVVTAVANGTAAMRITHAGLEQIVQANVRTDASPYVSISVFPDRLFLEVGERDRLQVFGQRADGAQVDLLANGEAVSFVSNNQAVVSVDSMGFVGAGMLPGQTVIDVRFEALRAVVEVQVRPPEAELVGIVVEPSVLNLSVGGRGQLRVTGVFSDGATADLTPAATGTIYGISDPTVASITVDGGIRALNQGEVEILVRHNAFTEFVIVTVSGDAQLVDLVVRPDTLVLPVGGSVQLQLIAVFSDGTQLDVSGQGALYRVDPPGLVQVSATGLVVGLNPGEGEIAVQFGGLEQFVRVTVLDDMIPVVGLEIVPPTIVVNVGPIGPMPPPIQVLARFADGSLIDVTSDPRLNLSIDNPNIAQLIAPGLVIGVQVGRTALRASFQGVMAVADVIVQNGPTNVVAIRIIAPATMTSGDSQSWAVFAILSDGSFVDVTFDPATRFRVTNPAVLDADLGLLTALAPGNAELVVEHMGQTDQASVVVTALPDPIVRIAFQPSQLMLQVGGREIVRLIATHRSGMTSDITYDPRPMYGWSGPIDPFPDPAGIALIGRSPGRAEFEATLNNLRAVVTVTVLPGPPPPIQSLEIITSAVISVGQAAPFRVVARFTNGSTQDVTFDPVLTITTGPPGIIEAMGGTLVGLSPGTARLTASYLGVQAQVQITVSASPIVSIFWQPSNLTLPVGGRAMAQLLGRRQNGQVADLSNDPGVTFTTQGPVQVVPGPNGLFIVGTAPGGGFVAARLGGLNARIGVTVTAATLTGIRAEPDPLVLSIGGTAPITVIGTFSDGSERPVTGATFQVLIPTTATVDPTGLVTGQSAGFTPVFVQLMGQRAILTVEVQAATLVSIRISPRALTIDQAQTARFEVLGRFSDGREAPVAADSLTSANTQIATVSPANTVTGIGVGSTTIVARVGMFSGLLTVQVNVAVGPSLTSINPSAVQVASPAATLTAIGNGFDAGATLLVEGQPVPTQFISSTTLQALVPGQVIATVGRYEIRVENATGTRSNPLELLVGARPFISTYAPASGLQGSIVVINVNGSGLIGLTVNAGLFTLVSNTEASDGSEVRLALQIPATAPLGPQTVTLSNPFGSASLSIDVLASGGHPDLLVTGGQVTRLNGTNVFNDVTVQTGGMIIGEGLDPLVIFATGDITIRGAIEVDGSDGQHGFTTPANGGAGGPGGGGGGAGGDGNTNSPGSGGAGNPPGENGVNGSGAGTPAGDGGGDGAGRGGSGGCGEAGGGGALGGDGGDGGGDNGIGSGGNGGSSSNGSNFGAGTGGGGGSTCGGNSGGGGGGGGGKLVLQVTFGGTLIVDGTLSARGGNGGNAFQGTGSGAGGSGGRIEILAPGGMIRVNDTASVRGGNGGDSDFGDTGGGGGGGIVVVDASPGGSVNTNLGLFDLSGGTAGISLGTGFAGRDGEPGTVTITP